MESHSDEELRIAEGLKLFSEYWNGISEDNKENVRKQVLGEASAVGRIFDLDRVYQPDNGEPVSPMNKEEVAKCFNAIFEQSYKQLVGFDDIAKMKFNNQETLLSKMSNKDNFKSMQSEINDKISSQCDEIWKDEDQDVKESLKTAVSFAICQSVYASLQKEMDNKMAEKQARTETKHKMIRRMSERIIPGKVATKTDQAPKTDPIKRRDAKKLEENQDKQSLFTRAAGVLFPKKSGTSANEEKTLENKTENKPENKTENDKERPSRKY